MPAGRAMPLPEKSRGGGAAALERDVVPGRSQAAAPGTCRVGELADRRGSLRAAASSGQGKLLGQDRAAPPRGLHAAGDGLVGQGWPPR